MMHTVNESLFLLFIGILLIIADRRFTQKKMRDIRLTQAVSIEAPVSRAVNRVF